MPESVSHPGVYIEEIPSGVHTIAGVDTSITACVGKAARGPVGEPQTINSFSDFEQLFGGLHRDFPLGYAVRDFFVNGGSTAIISRVYKPTAGKASRARIEIANFALEASSEGRWGAALRVRIDKRPVGDPDVVAEATRLGVDAADLFDLTIRDGNASFTETFLGLTTTESARRADRVLANWSGLVKVIQALPSSAAPSAHAGSLTDADVWTDDTKSTKAGDSVDGDAVGSDELEAGVNALEKADLFNLLCILPDARGGDVPDDVYQEALSLCVKRRAFLIVDSKSAWNNVASAKTGVAGMNFNGKAARNGALYFPRVKQVDPEMNGQVDTFPACGMIAGVIAKVDATRGVWRAPAGNEAVLTGVDGLQVMLNDAESKVLNPLGINCLRSFPGPGPVVWGARTLRGADAAADEYKYIPVRRTALFIEESLSRGLKWVEFEPNDELLWSTIRRDVGAFMRNLFAQGAFQGSTPRDAYLVKCGADTTTQNDVDLGLVNVTVGFAPLKPAEFVIVQLQLLAGKVQG